MKKIVKSSLALLALCSLSAMNVNAKNVSATDIKELSSYEDEGNQKNYEVFIYGKHVHIGYITFSDLLMGANSAAEIKDYTLYYKTGNNTWQKTSNADKWEDITEVSDLDFEMVKLVGTKSGDCIADDECEAGVDSSYVTTESYLDGRSAEVFLDESQDLSIVSIEKVNTTNKDTAKLVYNETSLANPTLTNTDNTYKLVLNAESPLLNYNNTTTAGKWIGLLIKTNRVLKTEDLAKLQIKVGDDTYKVDEANLNSAATYGGSDREFIMWLDASKLDDATITFQYNKEKKQTINVSFAEPTLITEYSAEAKIDADTITIKNNDKTANVHVKSVLLSTDESGKNEYVNIFYVESAEDKTTVEAAKRIDFTAENDKRVLLYQESAWKGYELIELTGITPSAPVTAEEGKDLTLDQKNYNWNQEAISAPTLAAHERTEEEAYDYVATINAKNVLKNDGKVKLNIDLGINNAKVNVTGAKFTSDSEGKTNGELEVVLSETGTLVAFENTNGSAEKVIVKFVVVYDESLDLTFTAAKASGDVDLYPGTSVSTEGTANANYRANMAVIDESVLKAVANEDESYTVRVQTTGTLAAFARKTTDGKTVSGKWVGVIVDLGVDPHDLTISGDYTISESDITDAKRFGATTDTAFIYWVQPANASEDQIVTFTYNVTNASVKVNFEVREIKLFADPVKAIITDENKSTVKVLEDYANDVRFVDSTKQFALNQNLKQGYQFVVSIDGVEYTYVVTTADVSAKNPKLVRISNLELTGVYKNIYTSEDATDEYLTQAMKSVKLEGNVIKVEFDRPVLLSNGKYAVVIDLGEKIDGDSKDTIKRTATSSGISEKPESRIESQYLEDVKGHLLLVVWVSPKETDINAEKEYKFKVWRTTSAGDATVPIEIVIQSTVNDTREDDVELKSETTESLDKSKLEEYFTDGQSTAELNNNKAISTEVNEKGEIVITYDKELTSFTPSNVSGNPGSRKYFGVLLDLGVDPTTLQGKASADGGSYYTFANNSSVGSDLHCESVSDERCQKDREKFGATGTQFIIWLDIDAFKPAKDDSNRLEFKTTFVSAGNSENQFSETTLTFVLVNGIDKLKTPTVSAINSSSTTPSSVQSLSSYKHNQDEFVYSYVPASNVNSNVVTHDTLTISPKTEASAAESVSIKVGSKVEANEWYAVKMDFGRAVNLDSSHNNKEVRLEHIENSTSFILWVSRKAKDTVTFKDDYNDTTYTVTIVNSEKVSSDTAA